MDNLLFNGNDTDLSDELGQLVNNTDQDKSLVSNGDLAYAFSGELRITFYSIIFLLSLTGNSLVILTLVQNHHMRTVLNVFLLNLSISDLLLAVFCMPFTLIPTLLKDFIFGPIMCTLIRYMQGRCK